MDDEGREPFSKRLRAVEDAAAKAKEDLEVAGLQPAEPSTLPSALWRETESQLSVAQPGEPPCAAEAIEYVEGTIEYGPFALLRNPQACIRPRGHEGEHASQVVHHPLRRRRWKALAWD